MNFPEVWRLKVKEKTTRHEVFSSNEAVALKLSSKLPVVKMMSILTPEADISNFKAIIKESSYYSIDDFNLSSTLTKNFVEGILKNGKLSCLPSNWSSDFSNDEESFAFENNKLLLYLNKEKLKSINAIELQKFKKPFNESLLYFEVDLLSDKLNITKLKNELKNIFESCSVKISWAPSSTEVCSSTIAKYFSDAGLKVKLCHNRFICRSQDGLKFPQTTEDFEPAEVSEFIGMVLLGCDLEPTDYSSYRQPELSSVDVDHAIVIHSKDFLTQPTISATINEIRKILDENSEIPFIALSLIFHSSSKLIIFTKNQVHSL